MVWLHQKGLFTWPLAIRVVHTHTQCESCALSRPITPPLLTLLPNSGVSYLSVSVIPEIPSALCSCPPEVLGDDDDEFDSDDDVTISDLYEVPSSSGWQTDVNSKILFNSVLMPISCPPTVATSTPQPVVDASKAPVHQSPINKSFVSTAQRKGDALSRMFIHSSQPPHIHTLGWSNLAPATRKSHIRWLVLLRAMPRDLYSESLGHAVVEYVLRLSKEHKWSPSTVAKAFSEIQSALRRLPSYTNFQEPIDLSKDIVFFFRGIKILDSSGPQHAQSVDQTTVGSGF